MIDETSTGARVPTRAPNGARSDEESRVTDSPFQVTLVTCEGAKTVRFVETVASRSPTSASVAPEIEAFRTRYGPPTRIVSFVPKE